MTAAYSTKRRMMKIKLAAIETFISFNILKRFPSLLESLDFCHRIRSHEELLNDMEMTLTYSFNIIAMTDKCNGL